MEVTVNGNVYHASPEDSDVARCYVCEGSFLKHRMVCVGPVKDMPGMYIHRCDDCQTGSPKWIKHFMHRSSVRSLFVGTELKNLDGEAQAALGRVIVEERRREVEKEIVKRLDARREGKKHDPGSRALVASGKKVGARSTVVKQRTRKVGARGVRVVRSRAF